MTSALNSATRYFGRIRGHEGESRIMGNAQVDAAVEGGSDSGSVTIPPWLFLSIPGAVAARMLVRTTCAIPLPPGLKTPAFRSG
jgi:hypothetical protein